MMIRRNIKERLETLAGFIAWDRDPYLVITDAGPPGVDGRWLHHFELASLFAHRGGAGFGRGQLYAQRREGHHRRLRRRHAPLHLRARRSHRARVSAAVPRRCSTPASEMPADLRRHARYPETLFRVQAEIYRTYHMLDPQAFYNKEDMWDLAQLHGRRRRGSPSR